MRRIFARFASVRRLDAMVLSIIAGLMATRGAWAQRCDPRWHALDPSNIEYPGLSGQPFAQLVWDPDGPGPTKPRLVVGGWFYYAGSVFSPNIATFDLETEEWSALGEGIGPPGSAVYALTQTPTGELFAGGRFSTKGDGSPLNSLGRWDGTKWQPVGQGKLGSGLGDYPMVFALASTAQGEVIAAGAIGSGGLINIGRWLNGKWSKMGGGLNDKVHALAVLHNGDIVAGGEFTQSGPAPMLGIARWDGVAWQTMGPGVDRVNALAVLPNGDLAVGGLFSTIGPVQANNVARWNGSEWSAFGLGMGEVLDLTVRANGTLVAAEITSIRQWNGTGWPAVPGAYGTTGSITELPNGDLSYGGTALLESGTGNQTNKISRWNGVKWSHLSTPKGFDSQVHAVAARPSGEVIVGGAFKQAASGIPASFVAKWDGSTWSTLESGVNHRVLDLLTLSNGDVIAGGSFTQAGQVHTSGVAKWDGSTWSALGAGVTGDVTALRELTNGDLLVGGTFEKAGTAVVNHMGRWDGESWSAIGGGVAGSSPRVYVFEEMPSGNILVGGRFTHAGGVMVNNLAMWDGAQWLTFGGSNLLMSSYVTTLMALPEGDVYVGGSFDKIGGKNIKYLAKWKNGTWSDVGSALSGAPYCMLLEDNGDLLVGALYKGSAPMQPYTGLVRWNGVAWQYPDGGLSADSPVFNMTRHPNGDILLAGSFAGIDGVLMPYAARFGCAAQGCYADCDGSGSLNIDDFVCFQTTYAMGDPVADCDVSGSLNIDDFVCFQTFYAMGC